MLDLLEKRIIKILKNNKVSNNHIEMYIDDIFSFNNKELYEQVDDEDIVYGFNKWLGEQK